MKYKFDEFQKNTLLSKGVTDSQIIKLQETIKLYNKGFSLIDAKISVNEIFNISNLKSYLDNKIAYGVYFPKVLRKIVEKSINNLHRNDGFILTGMFFNTIVNKAPDINNMGGDFYYKIFLYKDYIKVYFLDNIFNVTEIKDFKLTDIVASGLINHTVRNNIRLDIMYEVLLINIAGINTRYYMYSLDKETASILPSLEDYLKKHRVKCFSDLKNDYTSPKAIMKKNTRIVSIFIVLTIIILLPTCFN